MSTIAPPLDVRSAKLAPSRSMRAKFARELAALDLPRGPGPQELVTELELAGLPAAARRYLEFMRVVGRPRDWSFRARQRGVFRLRPDKPWMPVEVWQYNTSLSVARVFHMRMRFGGVMPVYVRDTYVRGHGRMLGRVLDAFRFVDDASAKIDTGELVTYLNDALSFAPSMLLGPSVAWIAVDDASFDVALTDGGRTVTARAFVDPLGKMTNFSTTDRYGVDPAHPEAGLVRARWSTPIDGWSTVGDGPCSTGGKAVWHFPSGEFCYADFAPTAIEMNVPPA